MCIDCGSGHWPRIRRAPFAVNGCAHRPSGGRLRQQGLTLIELVVFMVVISVGLAGILGVLNLTTKSSANPVLLKQQLAIAESLLEEIESKPFTWCDPDDANVTTAANSAACTVPQGLAHTGGESRYSQIVPFDNVGDYGDFPDGSVVNPATGIAIPGLSSYTTTVLLTPAGTALGLADNTAALKIDVSVVLAGQSTITLTGYRYRYAPNVP